MNRTDILEVKESMLEDLNADADRLREELKKEKTFYLNIMSSPGSGKTSLILKTLEALKDKYCLAVLEADIDSDVDMQTVRNAGFPSIQLHTGGMCHLDADMSRQGIAGMNALMDKKPDGFILENVGNLVCPAEFDTGAVKNVVILSVPEGDDKPLKYPLVFQVCDAVIVNKMDTLPIFDFDMEKFTANVQARKPDAKIFPVCSLTGEGVSAFADWLATEIESWKEN